MVFFSVVEWMMPSVSSRRCASIALSFRSSSGFDWSTSAKGILSIFNDSQSLFAITVALRFSPVRSDISPK